MTPHDDESYEFREQLRRDLLDDEEFRYGYAESFLNTFVAAQIKALREQRKMTQADLAEAIGTQQAGVSRLENVNYSAWKTETLRRIARALKVRLKISFETFGPLLNEVARFGRESLKRKTPSSDPILNRVTPQYVAVAQTWDGNPSNMERVSASVLKPPQDRAKLIEFPVSLSSEGTTYSSEEAINEG